MSYPETYSLAEQQQLVEAVRHLTERVARLENQLGLAGAEPASAVHEMTSPVIATPPAAILEEEESGLELRLGEFGLAWIGSIVFFLGIVFLMTYTQRMEQRVLATALGYVASAGMYFIARTWRAGNPYLSRVTLSSSLLMLYYTTMRLGFFSSNALIGNLYVALLLVLLVVALQLRMALKRGWQALAGIAILLGITSALLADQTQLTLTLVFVNAAAAAYLAIRRGWWIVLMAAIMLVYAAHLLWLMSNPVMGHPLQAVAGPQSNLLYLFLYAAALASPVLLAKTSSTEDARPLLSVFLNGLGFSALAALVVLSHFQAHYATVYLGVASLFLALAILQWLKTHEQLIPAIYACFGYMALSIALYGYARLPDAFLWLSLQSLLVVSMALWFRSRTLVVMNTLIYVSILLAYFALSPSSDWVNFSFALVAIASARVMNWQKQRLTLRTETLRNVYLFAAFSLVLYALYRAVPAQYVALSWTVAAVGFFLLSHLLHSVKYRWMAVAAMLITVVYLFLVDLARLDLRFRIAAFLFLGLLTLAISLFYAHARRLAARKQ